MHNGQGTRDNPSAMRVEDMITVELPDDGHVDRDYLRLVLRDPYTYLPPRRNRPGAHGEGTPGERESDLARRAKVLGLITASTLLVCAVIACAVLAQHPTRRSVAEDTTGSLTGIAALGALNAQRTTTGGRAADETATAGQSSPPEPPPPNTPPATTPTPAPERTSAPDEPVTATSEPATTPASGTRRSSGDGTVQPSTPTNSGSATIMTENGSRKFAVVREFYRRVAHDPGSATALLDLGLLGNQVRTLLTTWRSLEDVHLLRLHERPDGSVLAVVTMRRSDGRSVRITQVIEFAAGAVINHVQLLSAQHI